MLCDRIPEPWEDMKLYRIPLSIVIYRERDIWFAHCLEMNLTGDGDSKREAIEQLRAAIDLQIEASVAHKNIDNLFGKIDPERQKMFYSGRDVDLAVGELRIHHDNIEAGAGYCREYDGELLKC
jgi:hypothetical protein